MQQPILACLAVATLLCFAPVTLQAQGTGLMFNISGGTINWGINLGATTFVGANPFAASGSLSGGISNNPGMTAVITGNTGAQIGFGTNLFNPPAATLTSNAGTGLSAGAGGGSSSNTGGSRTGLSAGGTVASDRAALRALLQERAQLLASRGAGARISALNRQIRAEREQFRADRSQLIANDEGEIAGGATVSSDAAALAALFRQRAQLQANRASAFQMENIDSQIAVDRDQLRGDLETQSMAGGGMPASVGGVFHGQAAFGGFGK